MPSRQIAAMVASNSACRSRWLTSWSNGLPIASAMLMPYKSSQAWFQKRTMPTWSVEWTATAGASSRAVTQWRIQASVSCRAKLDEFSLTEITLYRHEQQ